MSVVDGDAVVAGAATLAVAAGATPSAAAFEAVLAVTCGGLADEESGAALEGGACA